MPPDPLYRPKLQTLCTPQELYVALATAWTKTAQEQLSTRAPLLVLLAHWALETGWGHACWNWNLGNYKHVAGDGRTYTMFRCSENINGQEVFFDPPNPATLFLAYDTLDAGALDYLTHLRGRFRQAWPAVLAGDPAQFCHLLKLQGYYTAPEATYTAGVVWCFNRLGRLIPLDAPVDSPPVLPDVVADEIQTPPDDLPPA